MDFSLEEALIGNGPVLLHTLWVGSLAYFGLIVWLRIFGKRTLSKWNSFDFVVTIALGSILASTLLNQSTSFLQSMLAFGLLIGFQFIITWLSVRTGIIPALVKSEPTLLTFKGEMIDSALREERVTPGEILAAIRLSGYGCLSSIDAVVLETDGSFSVIKDVNIHQATALKDVRGFKRRALSRLAEP
ncbi:MAG: DUF421 domain-containing protein [Phormidesmis sp. RL_2_1]|nr:DUF421 domain-containing protein [Phormidesmis sp. RL_2_1]